MTLRAIFAAVLAFAPQQAPFELREGDRVALVGDALIEREPTYGHVELALTRRFPGVTFRNLGWSGDTVLGRSRAGFGTPESGFQRLREQISLVRPTVVILGHGMASSFAGEAGLAAFTRDLETVIDAISKDREVRFVLLGPVRHETLAPPLPDPGPHNARLLRYADALRTLAAKRGFPFVPLHELPAEGDPYTDNGIHLTDAGYRKAAEAIERALGWPADLWRREVDADTRSFTVKDERLIEDRVLKVTGLRERTALVIDGETAAVGSPLDWSKGVTIRSGPEIAQIEALRKKILRKNELFFHRWRPQNDTYLYGFRRHEQGRHAKDLPVLEAMVEKEDGEIARLRKPVEHKYQLVPQKDAPAPKGPQAPPPPLPPPFVRQPVPRLEVAEGFEITLWAEAPMISKPINMNFDPQGRLWVASSSVYPQIAPGQVANDKIYVLEDTDRDGRADRSTVFAEGLFVPTGVEPGDGGCYVGQSTELLHLRDTDGDGKADRRRVVLSGFGTEDTHHTIHTLRWGHDGQLYFNQSIYIHSHLETPHGVVRLDSGGVLHLRPPTLQLGVFVKGFTNAWGHHFDEFGQSFITDGADGQGLSWGVPGAMYVNYAGARRILKSVTPGSFPKYCAHEIVSGRHLPDDWQGNAIANDFRANRTVRFKIREEGSAYVVTRVGEVVRSRDNVYRPIDVKMGPDGAIYIADWANPIVNHGEVDFRDERRDRMNGRIWRLAAVGRDPAPRPTLDGTDAEVLEVLKSPEGYARQRARRVLTERGSKVLPALAAWTRGQPTEKGKLEALWMYQSLDAAEPGLLKALLRAEDGRVRAAAVRVLSFWHGRVDNSLDLLAERIVDEHPRVRLEALRALARIPSARSAALALSVLDKPMDPFIDYALWLTVNDLAEPWLTSLASGEWKAEGRRAQLDFALKAIPAKLADPALRIAGSEIPKDGSGSAIELIGRSGGPAELRRMLDQVVEGRLDAPAQVRALAALGEAARLRDARPGGDLNNAIHDLLQCPHDEVRRESLRLAGRWKLSRFVPELLKVAAGRGTPESLLDVAFESLRELRGKGTLQGVQRLAGKDQPYGVRRRAALVLATLDPGAGAGPALETLAAAPDDDAALALWRALLSVRGAPAALASGLPAAGLSARVAETGIRAATESGREERELVAALRRGAGMSGERELNEAELKELAAVALRQGDAGRGEEVYRRKSTACLSCHAIGGAGGKVGPDLSSLGASAPADYLAESVLYPGRKVKEGFHALIVLTADGQVLSGVLVRETDQEVVLRTAEDREVAVPKRSVEAKKPGGSLMPTGLTQALKQGELYDLVRFLSELGKPGAFDASRGSAARAWRARTFTAAEEKAEQARAVRGAFAEPGFRLVGWVDGRVTPAELGVPKGAAAVYLAARFRTTADGTATFRIAAPKAEAWVNGRAVKSDGESPVDLPAGTHDVVLRLEAGRLPDYFRVESTGGVFLADP